MFRGDFRFRTKYANFLLLELEFNAQGEQRF